MNEQEYQIWMEGYFKGIINCLWNQEKITEKTYDDILRAYNFVNKFVTQKKG